MIRFAGIVVLVAAALSAQPQKVVLTELERPILERIKVLRAVPDAQRGAVTTRLALDIRGLPAGSPNRLMLADNLANLSTEGDFGRQTLQEVAITLAAALRERGAAPVPEQPYITLAQLVRYEGVKLDDSTPALNAAMVRLEEQDQARRKADFTLTDLAGKAWTLRALKGQVVLVNFWATWCPPCRKEMPDLEALSKRFADQGFVILAISDEQADKVKPSIAAQKITYPVLLDPDSKVHKQFEVEGIPKSFVYDREGKLVAQSIDMRTQRQFLEMLAQAGLQ